MHTLAAGMAEDPIPTQRGISPAAQLRQSDIAAIEEDALLGPTAERTDGHLSGDDTLAELQHVGDNGPSGGQGHEIRRQKPFSSLAALGLGFRCVQGEVLYNMHRPH